MNRWQQLGAGLVAAACLVVGGVALASSVADDSPAPPARVGDSTPAPTATDAPRATPAETPAPVAIDPAVQKQMAYVLAHWESYNGQAYGVVDGNDCVNFASQALIERGWAMDDVWSNPMTGSAYDATSAWVSSTALMHYIADSGRATALTDQQRDQVKVGDIAQFDWDNSGDRDHTGIVSRVQGSGDDIEIFYAGHTDDTDYRSVDWAITENHPGATAYYWSIP